MSTRAWPEGKGKIYPPSTFHVDILYVPVLTFISGILSFAIKKNLSIDHNVLLIVA